MEATNLHVSFDYCFKKLNGVLRKLYVGAKNPNGEQLKKENSLAKHKVTYMYESIFKEKRGIDILSDAVFHEGDEVFEVVSVMSVMLHNELIHILRTTFVLCVIIITNVCLTQHTCLCSVCMLSVSWTHDNYM